MFSPSTMISFTIVLATIIFSTTVIAEGRPGDDFRHTAIKYDHQAAEAVQHAATQIGKSVGRYMQLATIYREMAGIKRRAAAYADVDRWDKISWDEYQVLEHRRDTILDTLNRHEFSPEAQAATEYRQHADEAHEQAAHTDGVEQVIFQELEAVFIEMAGINDKAAHSGDDIDWSRFEELSARQQKLENMLAAGR